MSELKISKEKVLEAAGKCPQAKETLKTLWPEVFEEKGSLPKLFKDTVRTVCRNRNLGFTDALLEKELSVATVEFLLGRVDKSEIEKISYRLSEPDKCASEILAYLRREFEAVL